jgi:hypothetical protein
MIHYELYPHEGNFTGVIPKPYVTALGGESYKYVGGRKSRRKNMTKRTKKGAKRTQKNSKTRSKK